MTRRDAYALAYAQGFANMHSLAPQTYPLWETAAKNSPLPGVRGVSGDALALMPEAKSLIVLLRAYRPFAPVKNMLPVCAYYLCAHQGHAAAEAMVAAIRSAGHRAMQAKLPAKPSAMLSGWGRLGLHGILITPEYGSYVSLHLILTDAFDPDGPAAPAKPLCTGCGRCRRACPVGAISESGLDAPRCLRARLDVSPLDAGVKAHLANLLGCEICQRVCPQNSRILPVEPGKDVREAFDARRVLGSTQDVRAEIAGLVGKNIRPNRILAQTLLLCSREAEYLPYMPPHLESPSEMVRDAAQYALESIRRT